MDSRAIGRAGEKIAASYLEKKGYKILRQNYTVRGGEIDIIAESEKYIVFFEIKMSTRGYERKYGRPANRIDEAKKRNILFAAERYLCDNPTERVPRLDVIEIYIEENDGFFYTEIKHFPNAFTK